MVFIFMKEINRKNKICYISLHFLQIAERKSLIHGKHCTFVKVFNKTPSIQ